MSIPQRKMVFILLCYLCMVQTANAQKSLLQKQLAQSRNLTFLMKPDSADMGMTRWLTKPVEKTRVLPLSQEFDALEIRGPGTLSVNHTKSVSGKGSVLITTPASLAQKNPTNRSYASAELVKPLAGENLKSFNRFSVWVYADAPGFYSLFVGCTLYNAGKHIMPTPGRFEGQHFVNVYPGKWQHIVWEMPDLYRDSVTGLSVSVMLTGSLPGAADTLKLYVDDMRLETVETENTRGFRLRKNAIAYSNSGYAADAVKQALVQNTSGTAFQLVNASGKTVFTGEGKRLDSGFLQMDFSSFQTPGYYKLKTDHLETGEFAIGGDAWLATAWHALNFFYAERCGYDQPGVHQACHLDAFCVHPDGRKVPVSGGWHDAADVTQGVGNTARGGMAMLQLAGAVKDKNPILYERLLAEARWGLDWTLQTRFGDGYREGGLIMGIWSDNVVGTKDDMLGKAGNDPADNFIAASYEAQAVPFFKPADEVFALKCRTAAIEDFAFAIAMLGTSVNEKNETELFAQAVVSAMNLYKLTRDNQYLSFAALYARKLMACQQMERETNWTIPLHGFFYESSSKKRILAYFHRSNEAFLMEGLCALLAEAPNHPDASKWKASCLAYADYLHDISQAIKPYGILPAAIYETDNADFEGIYHEGAQVGMPSLEEYNAEVKNGIHLGGKFYLRRFPVAYQFRGFHAILMGKAKAAFLLAQTLHDTSLRNIATRQLEYIVGYNPFAMSTIFGDGYNYPPLYGGYAGDIVGATPVGIETFENEDEPYMPMQVNATYKEIWTHTTAAVLDLVAQIFKAE